MTKQIALKLNYEQFRKKLDELSSLGCCMSTSDSDLVAKCVFFVWRYVKMSTKINKTQLDIVCEALGMDKAEMMVDFLKDYYEFKNKNR